MTQNTPPQNEKRRVLLELCYHGADFSGWQIQPDRPSIQGALMKAFEQLCPNQPRVIGAGRTDAGVHALQQIAHVDLVNFESRKPETWLNALNSLTPARLWVKNIKLAQPNFHARFSPHTKTYQYHVDWSSYPNPFESDRRYHLRAIDLNLKHIDRFMHLIQGTHDFKNYCSIQNDTETTTRTLVSSKCIHQSEEHLIFEYSGKGFLQHMIRILTGTALHIGLTKVELQTAEKALKQNNMRKALGPTLPAHGLYLLKTSYSSIY